MKTSRLSIFLPLFLLSFLVSCGGGSDRDGRLVGIWVADRIIGDKDLDADQSTIFYYSDGTGVVYANEGALDILWDTDDDVISTTIPSLGVEYDTGYELDDEEEEGLFTTSVEGQAVTESYSKVTEDYPEELIASWGCVSIVKDGVAQSCDTVPVLRLEAGGVGSVLWNVTEGSLVTRDPATQLGGVVAYAVESGSLTTTDADDTGTTVISYQPLLL